MDTNKYKTEAEFSKKPFIHHVFFWLKNPNNEVEKLKLINGLVNLSEVTVIKSAHIGQPATTNRDVIENSYSVSWLLFFNNLEDQEIYQSHPTHSKFIEECSPLWNKVVVYDSI